MSPPCSIVFHFSSKVKVLISLFTFFQFYSVVSQESKVDNFAGLLFFFLIIIRSGLPAEIRWSVCMLKSNRTLCVSFSRTGVGLCIYHLFAWSNLEFLHISQWITLPIQLCSLSVPICCIRLLYVLPCCQPAKSPILQVLFYPLLIITTFDRLSEVRPYDCISKPWRTLCVSFSSMDSGLCIYDLFVYSNLNFLHNSQIDPFYHPLMSSLIHFLH